MKRQRPSPALAPSVVVVVVLMPRSQQRREKLLATASLRRSHSRKSV
ncbi:MAG: hypothetical protein Q8R56_09945 [Polaromonas sp.]|nr:hypothetical protein [Polaromonas sp.]